VQPLVNLTGTIQFQQAGSSFGSLRAFNFAPTLKNKAGSAVSPGLAIGFNATPTYQTDTDSVAFGTGVGFYHGPSTSVANGGTMTGIALTSALSAVGTIGAGTTVTLRRGFHVSDVTTLTGTLTTQVGLEVELLTKGTTRIPIRVGSAGGTFTAQPSPQIQLWPDTVTLDFASAAFSPVIDFSGTIALSQSASLALGYFVRNNALVKNTNAVTANLGASFGVANQPRYQADGATITGSTQVDFLSGPSASVANSGVMSSLTLHGFRSSVGVVGTGVTASSVIGFLFQNPSAATGTITELVGLDLEKPTRGTTNIAFRNAGTRVDTPTLGTISAVGSTIPITASTIRLNNSTGGSLTLTSTPTMADGVDGQVIVVFNSGTQSVVVQDQGTLASSNLRLGATTRTLATRDSLTLMYSSTVGDWIELAFSNVT
jgi:hypothetical protein